MIPDNVEKIIMTKEDYDRNVEQVIIERNELQQRIEKAVEYINNRSYFDGSSMCKVDLLNILNGKE